MERQEAIKMFNSKWWVGKPAKEVVKFQLYEDKLCMPFSEFHKAVEDALSRPVWTHEFADTTHLQKEFEGKLPTESNPFQSLSRILNRGDQNVS